MHAKQAALVPPSFSALMQQAAPFEENPVLAVAVSGGSDSLALIHLANEWAQRQKGRVIALTVEHGLRTASSAEAELVQAWMNEAGIEHHILEWEGEKPTSNIQASAREARYEILVKWCRENAVLHLLTAHHLDDQAETFLLRLQRGSGVDGLSAMPLIISQQGVRILRPLLSVTKTSLQIFLREKGLEWVEDPSNNNLHYARSHVRQFLQNPFTAAGEEALIPSALFTQRLADSARHMGRARASLEIQMAKSMQQVVDIYPEGYAVLKSKYFKNLVEDDAFKILASVLVTISGRYYKPRFNDLTRLYNKIKSQEPFKATTLWGCYIFSKGGDLICCREPASAEGAVKIPDTGELIWDSRFGIQSTGGDGIIVEALGEQGWHSIKEHYLAISLPKPIIITLPAIKSLESVIAVPHISFYSEALEKKQSATRNQYFARFMPAVPLAAAAFHYSNIK